MRMAENTPEGNPIKIEKKILLERSSVTPMVTSTNVINARIIDRTRVYFWFILCENKKKKKRFWYFFIYLA